jgi:long-chain acyl-CoA synthetase
MLAAQSLGAIPVPLYQDAVAAECVFPINNAEVRFAFAEDQEQVDKLLEMREQCPQLAHIYFDDPRGLRNYDEPGLASLDELIGRRQGVCARSTRASSSEVAKASPHDVAAMFFTSGTTGNPKGVVHTHNTLLDRARAGADVRQADRRRGSAGLPAAGLDRPEHLQLRAVAGLRLRGELPRVGGTVTIDLKEVGPTYYFAPPRVFEGLLTSVMIRMEDAGAIKRRMFHAFMDVARASGPA